MKSLRLCLFICSIGALDALDQATAENFQKRLAAEIDRLAAPAGDDIGVVAFDPIRASFAALDQLLTEVKNSIVAEQSVDLRAYVRTLDSTTKLIKELYQKAWSADQLGRYEALAAQRQELPSIAQNARREGNEAGARAVALVIAAFDQLDILQQRVQSYYEQYAEKIAARQKKLIEKQQEAPIVEPVQPQPVVAPVPENPQPKPVPPARQPAQQKPNIFEQGLQWLGQKVFDDPEAQRWYEYSFNEIPLVAEAVFVTTKLPVSPIHFNVWNERVHTIRLFVLRKAPELSTKGYLGFMGTTDDTLKRMYARKREGFTAKDATALMTLIKRIAQKRKELAALISAVRNDAWSSRYNRYGAELIDLVLAMHQYGAEQLRQEILDQIKKQQLPTEETSWKTKIKQFFGF